MKAVGVAGLVTVLTACGTPHAHPGDAAPGDAAPGADGHPDAPATADAHFVDAGPLVCAPVPPPPDLPPAMGPASGTRLVARTLAEPVANGVEVATGMWDSQLGIDCEPRPYVDGTIRCLPALSELELLPEARFADAQQTIPVVIEPLYSPPATGTLAAVYMGTAESPFSCTGTSLASFGRIGTARGDTQYYAGTSQPIDVPAGYAAFDLTPVASDFVELHEVRTQLAGPIASRELHGTDGSRLFAQSLYDAVHDVPVSLDLRWQRVLPPRLGSTAPYGHLAPGAVTIAWCDQQEPLFVPMGPNDHCDYSSLRFVSTDPGQTYAVAQITASLYGCSWSEGAVGPVTRVETVLAGCESVPLTDWTAFDPITLGSGRLTAPAYSILGVTFDPPWLDRGFDDAVLGMECGPHTASDGALRCLPRGQGSVAYSDASCTAPIVWGLNGRPTYALGGTIPRYESAPGGVVTVYSVGADRPQGTIYVRTPDGCHPVFDAVSFELGAVVPASTFAALERRNAP